MYRLLPGRWRNLVVTMPLCGFAGISLSVQVSRSSASLVQGGSGALLGLLIGVAVGLLVVSCVNLYLLPHDTRLLRLSEDFPNALVVNIHLSAANRRRVVSLQTSSGGGLPPAGIASLVSDGAGMSICTGALDPTKLVAFRWTDIALLKSIRPESRARRTGRGEMGKLEFGALLGDSVFTLAVEVHRRPMGALPQPFLNVAEVEELVDSIDRLRPPGS